MEVDNNVVCLLLHSIVNMGDEAFRKYSSSLKVTFMRVKDIVIFYVFTRLQFKSNSPNG